jgi:hypothetical protein
MKTPMEIDQDLAKRAYEYVHAKAEEFVRSKMGSENCKEACQGAVKLAMRIFLAGLPCSIVDNHRIEEHMGTYVLVRETPKHKMEYLLSKEEAEEIRELLARLGIYSRRTLKRVLEKRVDEFLRWADLSGLTFADMYALKLASRGLYGPADNPYMRYTVGKTRLMLAIKYILTVASRKA